MKLTNVFFWICISLCANSTLKGNEVYAPKEEFALADSLYQAGNFFLSAIEYERIFYFSNDSETRMQANLKRAEALKQQNEFARARNDLQRSVHLLNHPHLHKQVLYQIVFCDYMVGNYGQAISTLQQLARFYEERSDDEDVLLLFALAAVMNEQWQLAEEKTRELIHTKVTEIVSADSLNLLAEHVYAESNIPELKSEKRASLLAAVIPGSGHLYAGYPGKGAVNLTSQLLSLGIAGVLVYFRLYVSGFVVGLGSFQSFYFGGIKQATFLTHQRNLILMGAYKELLSNFVMDVYGF